MALSLVSAATPPNTPANGADVSDPNVAMCLLADLQLVVGDQVRAVALSAARESK